MATTAAEVDTDAAGGDFSNPLVDGELEQETNPDFLAHDDDLPPTKNLKKEKTEAEREEKKDWMENIKSTLVVSGMVIAVIGAIVAVVRKMKEA